VSSTDRIAAFWGIGPEVAEGHFADHAPAAGIFAAASRQAGLAGPALGNTGEMRGLAKRAAAQAAAMLKRMGLIKD
jgi:hypothetical protein